MTIYENVPLKKFNTFGLEYIAERMVHVRKDKDAILLFKGGLSLKKPILILGSGSNILFTENFTGTIICPDFEGIKVEKQDQNNVIISSGAGIVWDKLVEWSVNKGYSGLENLSLIPGQVGATPVQNIGAYGTEVKDYIVQVETIRIADGSIRTFTNEECKFGYRSSIFKSGEKGKYLVTRVHYRLTVHPIFNLNYGSLKQEVTNLGDITLRNVRTAVINIRNSKLPDPSVIGNAGSFFKNPVVSSHEASILKKSYPMLPVYDDGMGGSKLAAGWLIDQCGWKGKRLGDAGVHDKQALVIVNYGKATGKEIFALSEEIKKSVREKFNVELEREVEVVGAI